jgi:hypothetical protein
MTARKRAGERPFRFGCRGTLVSQLESAGPASRASGEHQRAGPTASIVLTLCNEELGLTRPPTTAASTAGGEPPQPTNSTRARAIRCSPFLVSVYGLSNEAFERNAVN